MSILLESFENLLIEENPSVFCIQETKFRKANQIKTNSTKHFTTYELLRKNSSGGGLCIGVHKDLKPFWVAQGDDEVEVLVVEIWVNEFSMNSHMDHKPVTVKKENRNFGTFFKHSVIMHLKLDLALCYQSLRATCHI